MHKLANSDATVGNGAGCCTHSLKRCDKSSLMRIRRRLLRRLHLAHQRHQQHGHNKTHSDDHERVFAAGLAAETGLPALGSTGFEVTASAVTGCTVSSTPIAVISFLMVSNRVFEPAFSTL